MSIIKKIFNQSTVTAFVLGFVVSTAIGIYFGSQIVNDMKAKYKLPEYSKAVQWMVDHPQYAEKVKKSYDTYMKAAEDTFATNLVVTEESK